ncbi:maleate cis-trans isomerase [Paraburkholderia sp.]|uniref:maleate cis-trans isomerase family protein n=1 Tax=Paraburkholderia sp. TaxID=1926495 RepID=UPI0039E3D18C
MQHEERVYRIGLLVPSSNTTIEREFREALPRTMSYHVARLSLTQIDAGSTRRIVEELEVEARKLADADVDVIVLAATAPSSRNGMGYDRELMARICDASGGRRATTASTAMLEALAKFEVQRIALVAPWSPAVNATVAAFLEQNGIRVVSMGQLGVEANLDVGRLPEDSACELAEKHDSDDADAIMLACGNWQTMGVIDRLESRLGKPVLSTNQVSLWGALEHLPVSKSISGYGVLLRDHLGVRRN